MRKRGVRDGLHVLDPPARVPLRFEQSRVLDRDRRSVGRKLQQLDIVARRTGAGCSVPTWSTPITLPATSSGTPSIDLIPFSRRIGLSTSAASMSSRITGRLPAATRPAKPPPTGIRTPASTSSSIPTAARATSSSVSSSSSRTAQVSTPRMSRIRGSSTSSSVLDLEMRQRGVGDGLEPLKPIRVTARGPVSIRLTSGPMLPCGLAVETASVRGIRLWTEPLAEAVRRA